METTNIQTASQVYTEELWREQFILRGLEPGCVDCQPEREQRAHELAFWGSRISVSRAVELIHEQISCTHEASIIAKA